MKRYSTVVIIGKPNSGKSTLFNRLVGSRKAITHERPGVTRDRMEAETSWNGIGFVIVDTGGFSLDTEDPLQEKITAAIVKSVRQADVIVFLVDVDTGPTAEDLDLLRLFREQRDKMILAVNKVESGQDRIDAAEFYSLGFAEMSLVSSLHGSGVGDMLDRIVSMLPQKPAAPGKREEIRISIIGKPNVGKSSLVNALSGEERNIVSEEPGTTRDSVDLRIKYHGRDIILVDTAGVKRKSRTDKGLDSISSMKSLRSVEEADVVIVMIDASEDSITQQDIKIASAPHKARKGVLILINKWDLVKKDDRTLGRFIQKVRENMAFISYAPVITISALEKTRLGKIFPECIEIHEQRKKKIATSQLNKLLESAQRSNPPSFYKYGTGKIYYGTQTGVEPPTFTLFVNKSAYFPRSYIRYINNQIRKVFTFKGTAVKILLKSKE